MKISHESPIALLEESRTYNDYDYCLVHLLDKYPAYKNFFIQSKQLGRRVLLDNSIFELGVAFEADKFAEKVKEIQPDEYIVPDVLEDCDKTIKQFISWNKKYNDLPGKKIGVIQGKNFNELLECYCFMALNADKIAISFDYSFYLNIGHKLFIDNDDKWQYFMTGRQRFISILVNEGYWSEKPHHLLGAALPQEFMYYPAHNIEIDSVDTSNPIVHGLHGVKYGLLSGLPGKISTKLADLIEADPNELNIDVIKQNIKTFRAFTV